MDECSFVNMTCDTCRAGGIAVTADVAVLLGCGSASRVEMSVSWTADTQTSTIPLRKRKILYDLILYFLNRRYLRIPH